MAQLFDAVVSRFLLQFHLECQKTTIVVKVDDHMNVKIVGVGSIPRNYLIGEIFPRCADGALMSTLWTICSRSGHYSGRSESSDSTDRNVQTSYLPRHCNTPLDQGNCGNVNRCRTLRHFVIGRTVSLRKCLGPYYIRALETPKAADDSMMEIKSFDASVFRKGKSHL